MLREMVRDRNKLYLPSSQALYKAKAMGHAKSFVMFQEFLSREVEKAFEASGLLQKS